jgi:hypothetical protein
MNVLKNVLNTFFNFIIFRKILQKNSFKTIFRALILMIYFKCDLHQVLDQK